MTSCVYWIANKETGKVYIGSAAKVMARWRNHRQMLRAGDHHSIHLQRAWDKHGESAFLFEILAECRPVDLTSVEQEWMDFYGREWLYNMRPDAASMLGYRHSEETRMKMRRVVSDETKRKMSEAAKARDNTHLRIAAEKRRGVPLSEEAKAKLRGKPCWNKGKQWSPEHRAILSAAHSGKPRPWRVGVKLPPGTGAKIAAANRGRIQSAEERAMRSAAIKAMWASGKRSRRVPKL